MIEERKMDHQENRNEEKALHQGILSAGDIIGMIAGLVSIVFIFVIPAISALIGIPVLIIGIVSLVKKRRSRIAAIVKVCTGGISALVTTKALAQAVIILFLTSPYYL